MSQNGQTHFKNLAANAARFLKCVWPCWDIMYQRVKVYTWIHASVFKILGENYYLGSTRKFRLLRREG